MTKLQTSMRLSQEATDLIELIAEKYSFSKTAAFELAIRKFAESENIKIKKEITNE